MEGREDWTVAKNPYSVRVLRGRIFLNRRKVPHVLDCSRGTYDIAGDALDRRPVETAKRAFRAGYDAGMDSVSKTPGAFIFLGDVW